MFGLFSPMTFLVIGLYAYVAVAAGRAKYLSGASFPTAFFHGLLWPVTIWHTIKSLYLSDPGL